MKRENIIRGNILINNSVIKTILCTAISSLLWCAESMAQETNSSSDNLALEEIIVTTQRREQSLNDVPIAVSAFQGKELRERGVQTFEDITRTIPNVAVGSYFASRAEISIRGVAMSDSFQSTDQQPTGIYQDGVFLGSRAVHLAQIFDLDRVEIARGPQGVLFGRNTTSGAVRYMSKAPDEEPGGYINANYGNFGTGDFSGAINLPISDAWGIRLSGKASTSDGWAKNVFTDQDVFGSDFWGVRAVVQYADEASTWTLNIHASDYEGNSGFYFNSEAPGNEGLAFDELQQQSQESPEDIEALGANLTGNFSMGGIDIVSVTSFETSDSVAFDDFGPGVETPNNPGQFVQFFPFISAFADEHEQFSQEFRLSGGNDKIDWVGGVLAYYEDIDSVISDGGFGAGTIGLDFNGNGVIDVPDEGWFPEDDRRVLNQSTEEVGAFFHLNYSINEQLTVLGGLRYTYTKKDLEWQYTDFFTDFDYVPKTKLDESWNPLTYRVGLEYKPDGESLYYFRYDHGFKNGGFSVGGSSLADLVSVDPEEIDSFEVGSKLTLANGRVQLNMAAFYNDIEDYQANLVVLGENGVGFALQNAAEVSTKGVELEINYRATEALLITGGLGYTDATFKDYVDPLAGEDFSGNIIPIVPEWSGNISVSYDFFLGEKYLLTPRIDYAYTGEMQGRPSNSSREVLDERHIVNAQVKWGAISNDSLTVTAWVKNAIDEEYHTKNVGDGAFAPGIMAKRGLPRTYGVTIGYEW